MNVLLNARAGFTLQREGKTLLLNDAPAAYDLKEIRPGSYHLLYKGQSFLIEVLQSDPATRQHRFTINGKKVTAELQDKFDALLKELGMDAGAVQKTGDLKAPMPGLVVEIPVQEGDAVKKGDTLVILEAMKMENALKAAGDAVVKKIVVKKGQAVDKNTLLVQMA